MSRGLDRKAGENMLGKTKTKWGRIGIEGIVVGIVLCMLIGMIPAQVAQAESTETIDDVQYTIYGTVYGIDGITPAKDVFVMATNNTGYGDYTYTDENGNYAIILNWTYNISDLVNVAAINGIRMGNASFTVTSNNNVEVNIVLQTIPEWWPSDPREILFESESGNSTSKTLSSTKEVGEQGQRNIVSKNIKASMETYNTDLVIPDYQEYENTELNLYQCDLIIESGGHLVLKNTTVTVWNNDTEGKYGISVLSNETSTGVLEVLDNSVIQAQSESGYYYHFNVYGNLLIDHSTIKWMSSEGLNYTNPDVTMPSGIRLYPDSRCTIQNNTVITNGRTHNIYADATKKLSVKDSAVLLAGNSTQMGYGVYATDASRVTINGSSVVGCANHGVYADECILEITRSRISENGLTTGDGYGVYCHSFSPTMSQNNITNNNGGIYCHSSSPTITYNNITDNLVGVRADFSSPKLSYNYIQDGKKQESTYGVYSYFSSFTASNNTVSGYNFGFYLYYSPLTILNNHVLDNLIGVYLDNSGATIRGNNISANYGAGVFSEYSTGVSIVGNNLCENTPFGKLVESGILGEAEGYGVYAKKSSMAIKNNNINGNGRAGIYYGESNSGVYAGTIMDNVIENQYTVTGRIGDQKSMGTGIFCVNASVTITNNEILGNVEGITSVSSSTTISGNDIDSNKGFSESTRLIWFPWPRPGHWKLVTITSTIGWGVYTEDSSSTISNNNISENHNGIVCEYNSYTDIVNNNITSNDYGLWFDESSFGDWSITDTSIVRDNEIWLNGNLTVYNSGSITLQTTASGSQCYFLLNPKQDGAYQIEVLNGGTLTADNFGFWSATDYHYLFKVRDGAALTLTGWSGIGYCGYNSTSPENMGLFIESDNVLIENCWFQENYCGVIISGTDVDIVNTTFDYNTWDMYLRYASVAECLNTTFDENKVWFEDAVSVLNVYWYLHVNVMNETWAGVEDASVTVYDNVDNIVFEGQTDVNGWIRDIVVHDYTRNQTSTIIYTPHNITATKTGVGSAKESNVTMDCSKAIILILQNTLPELSFGNVSPSEGNTSVLFTYTVTYTDADNDPPHYVKVCIDGIEHVMVKENIEDETFTDGCVYTYSTYLQKASHTYYFEAMDWQNTTRYPITDELSGPVILNRAPEIVSSPPVNAIVGQTYIYEVNAFDPDNDTLVYFIIKAPGWMIIDHNTGMLSWVPTENQIGDNLVIIQVSDNDGGNTTQEFNVSVDVNFPPIRTKNMPDVSFKEDKTLVNAFNICDYFFDFNTQDMLTYSCSESENVFVTVNPDGTVDFSAGQDWYGTEEIILRATDPYGESANGTVLVRVDSVNDPPTAKAGSDQRIVVNDTIRLTGTGYDVDKNIVLYEWDFDGDGNYEYSFSYHGVTTHKYTKTGNYTARFRATDSMGATAVDTCLIEVLPLGLGLPIANATFLDNDGWDDGVFCVGHNVIAVGSDSSDPGWFNPPTGETNLSYGEPGEIVEYVWDWRDMTGFSVSGEPDATHVYSYGQDYEIVLTVKDNQSFTDTDSCVISVVYPPQPSVSAPKQALFRNSVAIHGAGYRAGSLSPHGYAVEYSWDFGDGSTTTTSTGDVSHKYMSYGTFTITLTVKDNYGFNGSTSCVIEVVDNEWGYESTGGPYAYPGGPYCVKSGHVVTLQGSGYDPKGRAIEKYHWKIIGFLGETVVTSTSDTTGMLNWTAGSPLTYTAKLRVMVKENGQEIWSEWASTYILVYRTLIPTVSISPFYQQTFGNRTVNFTLYASDEDGWIKEYEIDFGNGYSRRVTLTDVDSPVNIVVSHYYWKPKDEDTLYKVRFTVVDNESGVSRAIAYVKVYANVEPLVFLGGDQAKYVDASGNTTVYFPIMFLDVDDSVTGVNVDFGDGNTTYYSSDKFTAFNDLSESQKEDLTNLLKNLTANISDSVNPLMGMLRDMLWMYNVSMDMVFGEAFGQIPGGDVLWSLMNQEYAMAAVFAFTMALAIAVPVLALPLAALGLVLLLTDAAYLMQESYERGLDNSVNVFMAYMAYDLKAKAGFESCAPLITLEELSNKMYCCYVNHTYPHTPSEYPVTYEVVVNVTDDDNAVGNDTCNVTLFDNIAPVALTEKEYWGRKEVDITFHSFALDFEKNIAGWEWDFGDGTPKVSSDGCWTDISYTLSVFDDIDYFGDYGVTGPNVTHKYAESGIYTATLNVTDDKGLYTTMNCTVYVCPLADAGEDKNYRVKKDVPFNGTGWTVGANIKKYTWDCDGDLIPDHIKEEKEIKAALIGEEGYNILSVRGSGVIVTGWFNTTHFYEDTLVCNATFTIRDGENATANDQCKVIIHENNPPHAVAELIGPKRDGKVKNQTDITFSGANSSDPDGDPLRYQWFFGDGCSTDWLDTPMVTHLFDSPGDYYVTLRVKDDANVTDMDTVKVTVVDNWPPVANAGIDKKVYVGAMLNLISYSYDEDGYIVNWTWNWGDGSIGYGEKVNHTYSSTGEYVVTLTVTDNNSATDTDTCNITVVDNMPPVVEAGIDQKTLYGITLDYFGTATDPDYDLGGRIVKYRWDFGDGKTIEYAVTTTDRFIPCNASYQHYYPGNYTVTLTAWDDKGAFASDTCRVEIVNIYGDIFPPKSVLITSVLESYSYTDTSVVFSVNITDDYDPEPFVDVWVDDVCIYAWLYGEVLYNNTIYTTTVEKKDGTHIVNITIDMSILSLGKHVLKVRAMDAGGNTGTCTINFTVIDDRSPESYVNTITPYWHNNAIIITATASDERSNITNVTLYYYNSIDNITWYGPHVFGVDETSPWSWDFTFPNGEGYYKFYTIAWDEAGNQEIFTVNDTACGYDITSSESEVNIITPYWQTNNVFIITATGNDNLSGVSNVALYYRYSSDNVTWSNWALYETDYSAPWEWNFNTSTLYGDGYYQFYTIATDVAGNMETAPESPDTVCGVDTGMPTSSVTLISPYWQTTTQFIITASASNGMSGIAQVTLFYRYSTDNASWGAWTSYGIDNNAPYEWLFNASRICGDGYYQFYTIAKDISGNSESAPTEADTLCGVDTHAPCSSANLVLPYWQNTLPFTITVSASDEKVIGGSGIAEVALYYRYSADNSSWSTWALFGINKTKEPYVWNFTAPKGDGYYQFYSIAVDNAGNTQETFTTIVCGVDTNAPTTTDDAPTGWQNTTVNVTLTSTDNLSGVAYTEYKLWIDGEGEPIDWNIGITVMINSDGTWNIKYRSVDNAGNVETNNTVQVQVDMTAPSTSCELTGILGDNNWFTTKVTVTLIATDMTSGVNCTKYRVDYGDWMMYDGGFELSTEGAHLVEYYSVDNAGNVEKVTNITVKIDKTPPSTGPTITGTTGENNWYTSDVTVNLSSIDATSGVNYTEYKLDGSGWQTYTGNFTVSSDGEHVVEYHGVDNAGNVETYKTAIFKIDQTPPTANSIMINNDDEYTNTTTVQLSLSASDSTSGIWMMQFKNELNGTWNNWTPYDTSMSWIIQDMEGERTVYFRVKDEAGLISDETSDTITLDKTSPVIVNIVIIPSVQEVYGFVNITTVITDNYVVDTVEIEIIQPNGTITAVLMEQVVGTNTYYYNVSYSLLGWYNFTIRADDLANNFATGEGNFFIDDTTKPEISNIQSSPETQDVFDSVNITCTVIDNVKVKDVYVNITNPEGTIVSILMENIESTDVYYYNTTYQINGTYHYSVWVIDTSDNQNSSMIYTFNITRRTTTLIYTGENNGQYSDNVILSGVLMDTKSSTPIFNRILSFTFADYNSVGITGENGTTIVTFTLTQTSGNYTVIVSFSGDEYYLSSAIEVNFTVEKENTMLSTPNVDIIYSDNATLSVTMTDEENEPILHQIDEPKTIRLEYYNMTIWIPLGNATLVNGTATFELSIPEDFNEIAGIYDIRVRFDGDSRYNPANTTGILTILGENVVISDPSFSIVYSDNATVTITIVDDDNESLLHEEDVEIILEFYHTVWRLRMRWDPYTHEIIVYWVREGVWTEIDRTTMINGSITFNVSIPEDFSETAGNYSLRAVFGGNNRYNAASTYGTLTILKENVVLSDPSFTIVYMNSTSVTINVTDDDGEELIKYVPSGPFIERDEWRIDLYYFNGTEWKLIGTERLSNGSVTFDIFMPDNLMEMPGIYELMLYFDGNGTYNDAVRYGNLTIVGGYTDLTYTGAPSGHYSDDVLLSAILTDYFGVGMPNRTITFTIGNQTVNATTNETGVAMATLTLLQIPGNYTLTVEFLGDEYYFSSNISVNFTIERKDTILTAYDIVVSDPVNDTLTAMLMEDSTPIASRNIEFYINNTYIGTGITNETGVATYSIPFVYLFGNFTWAAEFTGDDYYLSSNSSANLSSTHEAKVNGIITMIDKLITDIENSNITDCVASSLISKLQNAKKKVTQENFNAADNIMNAFQNELDAQHGKEVSEEQYQSWYSQSENVRYALQWMMNN